MMNQLTNQLTKRVKNWRTPIMIGLLAIGAAFVLGAGRGTPPVIHVPGEGDRILPRVEIIQWGDSVARFDTTTGEIHRYHGDLDKPNVRGQWVSQVRGVSDNTSGLLQLQRPRGVRAENALFLVDAVTGDTWLLRHRGTSAAWEKIDIVR
jgi:hypothetical protein